MIGFSNRVALAAGLMCASAAALEGPPDRAIATEPLNRALPDAVICMQVPIDGADGKLDDRTVHRGYDTLALGSRIVSFDPSSPNGGASSIVNLTAGFAAAGRPDLSFDATKVLFVGRRNPADPLSVWEMDVDGSNLRQVTSRPDGCDEALYLSTIYTLDAEKPVYQIAFGGKLPDSHINALYTCRLDGSRVTRITFSPHDAFNPYLLSDGRLLFSLGASPDGPSGGSASVRGTSLFTVYTDGTDVFPFAAIHEDPAVRGTPCETPDGWVVYVESKIGSRDRGGSLMAVARTRSLRTRRRIADDSDGTYHSPTPLPDGKLLVSFKTKQGKSYGLYVFDMQTGRRTDELLDTPQWDELDAIAVAPRREPEGRSSVVVDSVDTGQVYCMNAYLSDTAQGDRITPGQIKRLRVYHSLLGTGHAPGATASSNSMNASTGRETGAGSLLGEVPVEPDGSFFFDVPARTPLRLETLDQQGAVLQSMKSWFWVMPKEARGCIGCHEDRELTPPNRHVLALRKMPKKLKGAGQTVGTKGGNATLGESVVP